MGERRYGAWAGNPKGHPEDTARCVVSVRDRSSRWPHYHQCDRKRGHGEGGLLCKQHAKKQAEGTLWPLVVPESRP